MLKNAKPFDRTKVPKWLQRFCPDYTVTRIHELDPEDLKAIGVRGILLDLDNTLLPWKSLDLPKETIEWVEKCRAAGLTLCLVSNTRNLTRLRDMADTMGMPAVAPAKMKPSRMGFLQALKILEVEPTEAVMIGDQMFTDVWGGNRAGIRTIWVERMAKREFFGTKFSRMAERILSNWIRRGQST